MGHVRLQAAVALLCLHSLAAAASEQLPADIVTVLLPLTSYGIARYKGDVEGSKQFLRSTGASLVVNSSLRLAFNGTSWGERPNGPTAVPTDFRRATRGSSPPARLPAGPVRLEVRPARLRPGRLRQLRAGRYRSSPLAGRGGRCGGVVRHLQAVRDPGECDPPGTGHRTGLSWHALGAQLLALRRRRRPRSGLGSQAATTT